MRAGESIHRLAVLDNHHRGQAAHPELLGDHLLLIGVDFGQQKGALVLVGDFLQQRHQNLARLTPVRPKIHHYGALVGFLYEELSRIGLVDSNDKIAHATSLL